MKLALIFLFAAVVITNQQFQQQREKLWWSPYFSAERIANYHHPIYYDPVQYETQFFRQYRPMRPIPYLQSEVFQDSLEDVHSRTKDPSLSRPKYQYRPQERLFVNFAKTATFTVTSSLSITSIQSCIAAAKFLDDAAKSKACRRKREILDVSGQESTQFPVIPSKIQELVMPTALPSLELNRENRQVSFDQNDYASLGEISGSISPEKHLREKRFFNFYSVTSTTITTYSIMSTTSTKTVAVAGDGEVECLPSGWVVC
ncbi:uncharacterized protein LOC130690333 [Daphnia carinata]|uniref:uncharacterized protein LOC130690333 n=1 Tax=Daphnia carinata TaxID=120202 RepID=UPI002580AC69|nr:uncharacterized protein LOC130690333 [Daphnia carinata]